MPDMNQMRLRFASVTVLLLGTTGCPADSMSVGDIATADDTQTGTTSHDAPSDDDGVSATSSNGGTSVGDGTTGTTAITDSDGTTGSEDSTGSLESTGSEGSTSAGDSAGDDDTFRCGDFSGPTCAIGQEYCEVICADPEVSADCVKGGEIGLSCFAFPDACQQTPTCECLELNKAFKGMCSCQEDEPGEITVDCL